MKRILSFLALCASVCHGQIITNPPSRDRTFYVESYGAKAGDSVDDRAAIQRAIDAAIAAPGGVVKLAKGTYNVTPTAGGIALLVDGDYMTLEGSGEGTEIEFSTAGSAAFCGIAPYRYNTCTAPYTAAPLVVRDLRLTMDSYTDVDGHDLIGICHCPWAIVERVGFEQARGHALEINVSKNVLVEDCYVYGTGNFTSCILELDGLGAAGIIATGGTHSQSTPIENIVIRRFIQRVPRTDLTIDCAGYDFMLLSHSNASNVIRNVTVEDCRIIPHQDADITSGTETNCIAFDSASLPLEFSNFTFRRNTFSGAQGAQPGGITGSSNFLNLMYGSASSTRRIRNVVIEGNVFDGTWYYPLKVGLGSSDSNGRTSITNALLENFQNVVVKDNYFRCGLNANNVGTSRTPKGVWMGAMRQLTFSGNTYHIPNISVGSGWNSGTMYVNTGSFGFFFDHVQDLICANNYVETAMPIATRTWNFTAYAFGVGGFEVSGIPAHYVVTGNQAHGTGTVGGNLSCAFAELITTGTDGLPQWISKARPFVTGDWRGNVATSGGTITQTTSTFTTDHTAETLTITSHGLGKNERVQLYTTGTYPTGLAASTNYYVIVMDANTIQLASAPGVGAAVAATWTRASAVITVTSNLHRLTTGNNIVVTATSDAAAIPVGTYSVTVSDANTFTVTGLNAGGASGTLSYTLPVTFTSNGSGTLNLLRDASLPVPLTALTSQSSAVTPATAAAIGVHDWQPAATSIGEIAAFPTGALAPSGFQLLDGRATTLLSWREQAHWNLRLGLSGTANLPTTADTYIRLTGQ